MKTIDPLDQVLDAPAAAIATIEPQAPSKPTKTTEAAPPLPEGDGATSSTTTASTGNAPAKSSVPPLEGSAPAAAAVGSASAASSSNPSPAQPAGATPSSPAPAAPAAKRLTLFDLEARFLALQLALDDGAEISDVELASLGEQLAQTDEAVDRKAEAWSKWIKSLESDATAAKVEADRLDKRGQSFEKFSKRLREKLRDVLIHLGKDRVKTALFTISVKSTPPSVGEVSLPDCPRRFVKIVEEVDRKAILDEYKRTKVLPGYATIVTNKKHLEIR